MKKKILFGFILFWASVNVYSQSIVVNPNGDSNSTKSLENLIKDVFIGPTCATIENISTNFREDVEYVDSDNNTQTGAKSFSYFTHSGSNFPMNKGIILSTGAATQSQGPSADVFSLSGFEVDGSTPSWAGDADIKTILDTRFGDNEPTTDATTVEFDFTPFTNNFSFQYLFASEEYEISNYECESYQDGFAFLVSGPGITPDAEFAGNPPATQWRNIALLPDGVTPVSAGTVHNNIVDCSPAQNPSLYVSNFDANGPTSPIAYNGRTIVFTASQDIQAGQTYRMKLVIADRTDAAEDSAVFLLAGSFNAGGAISLGDDISICEGESTVLTVNSSFSNATYEWQYNGTVLSGETSTSITTVQPGTYVITATEGLCSLSDTIEVLNLPSPNISDISGNTEICQDDFTNLMVTSSDSGLTYQWQLNGSDIPEQTSASINTDQTGEYTVTASPSSGNGCSAKKTITVTEKQGCSIPTGISPNNDGLNDSFDISWLMAENIQIFNRYGTKVYEKANYRNEWYGKSNNGNDLPTGTYYYVVTISGQLPIIGWVYVNREY
ncbi:MAG: hypothetical protein COA88_01675 [Kordia sp.]|nr:MAG: hypothetical protein COA88_01675 [Kordia sp.]